jgi:hypothetical protein
MSPIPFNLYSEYFNKEVLERFGNFKIGRQVNRAVKYVDDIVLVAKEGAVLQSIPERRTEIGNSYEK